MAWGAVVLDEFHERTLDADLALGAIMQLQADRPDLQLLVMSATLETAAAGRVSESVSGAAGGGQAAHDRD